LDYSKLTSLIPTSRQETLSDKLVDIILASKNDDKMPGNLAKIILYHWQNDNLKSEAGLVKLLEAATSVELEKTLNVLNELQMPDIAERIKQELAP